MARRKSKLELYKELNGLTWTQLGDLCGLARQQVWEIATGYQEDMMLSTALRISKATGIKLQDLTK